MMENNIDRFGRPVSENSFVGEPVYDGFFCSIVSVVDLLGLLRDSFSADQLRAPARCLLHRCRTDAVVILDDIGAEKP